MSDWWQEPYKGAPPPKGLPPLPRSLYPPDAKQYGKTPSSRGPDVKAIKRGVSRGGRWPWQTFDDGYWDDFAHGTAGPDVPNSGVAGFQYQQHIDASGWYGPNTYSAMSYALVPAGRPHAGEHLFDSVAIQLLNEAWELFQGHEPPPSGKTVRQAALAKAVSQLGVKESPAGSNQVKYSDWYGMTGPWCAMFATWAYELGAQEIGTDSPSFRKGQRYAYVPYIVGDARNGKNHLKTTDDPEPGDLVCYDWGWDGEYDHIGLFEKWAGGGSFQAIEGNTSSSSNSNGGEVMRRTRSKAGQGTVFVKVQEP